MVKKEVDTEKPIKIDNQIVENVLEICLYQQIEESYHWMSLIEQQIKFCEIQILHLKEYKPYWFQRKKLKEHNKDIEILEDRIWEYYKKINDEIEIIEKMIGMIGSALED